MEHRDHTRVPVPFPGRFLNDVGHLSWERGVDLSAGGVRFQTDAELPLGTAGTVQIEINESHVIEAEAEVARSVPGELALQFTALDFRCYEGLRALLLTYADDPDRIELELEASRGIVRREED